MDPVKHSSLDSFLLHFSSPDKTLCTVAITPKLQSPNSKEYELWQIGLLALPPHL